MEPLTALADATDPPQKTTSHAQSEAQNKTQTSDESRIALVNEPHANIEPPNSPSLIPVIPQQAMPLIQHTLPTPVYPVLVDPPPQVPVEYLSETPPLMPAPANPSNMAAGKTPSIKTITMNAPNRHTKTTEITANRMTKDELLRRAKTAIERGSLNETPGMGALYYLRLLERIEPQHPQLPILVRDIVKQYHRQARRDLMRHQDRRAANQLWMSSRIIKEFNLVEFNPIQQRLEHRLGNDYTKR